VIHFYSVICADLIDADLSELKLSPACPQLALVLNVNCDALLLTCAFAIKYRLECDSSYSSIFEHYEHDVARLQAENTGTCMYTTEV
jgi:hypothetical protein